MKTKKSSIVKIPETRLTASELKSFINEPRLYFLYTEWLISITPEDKKVKIYKVIDCSLFETFFIENFTCVEQLKHDVESFAFAHFDNHSIFVQNILNRNLPVRVVKTNCEKKI